MRQAPPYLRQLVEPAVTALGFELVGVEYAGQGQGATLRVYIDSDDGISADDCQRVSHQISGVLEVEDPIKGHYILEVSSPGLDRPLFTVQQFMRFIGHRIKLRLNAPLNGQRNFAGILLNVSAEEVLIATDDAEISLAVDNIDKARLVPNID